LTHQVSDWVAHYREVERDIRPGVPHTFRGYANSHQVLEPYFHPDILVAKREAEHALTETLHDAYIMFTDTTGLFGPGRVKVDLLTDEDVNLISVVSETFADFGCSKIPVKHLEKMQEDFDVVIKGIQAGILFVKHMQPKFEQIVKEFVEDPLANRQAYIDESVNMVVDQVLSFSEERATEEPGKVGRSGGEVTAASVVSAKPESTIHKLAFSLGKTVSPEIVDVLFATPLVRFRRKILVFRGIDIEIHLRDRVRAVLPDVLKQFGGRSESTRALVNFARELISASDNVMERAHDAYCSELHPVTALDPDPDQCEEGDVDSVLKDMINKRVIKIRFTPARLTKKDNPQYLLKPDTAIIRINGYLPDDENAPFTVGEPQWDDETGEILKYEIRLKKEALRGECLDIFADISDRRREHSQYIDKQIRLASPLPHPES
jgi:hypothetical protein